MRVEPPKSGPSQQEKGKAASRNLSFGKEVDENQERKADDDDDDFGEDSADDYVSHGLYRDVIAKGFRKRSPSIRLAANKPAYYPIDDPVTRTLPASKYSAKTREYSITLANAFFLRRIAHR